MADDRTSEPARKIDDTTYGTLPQHSGRRWLLEVKRWFLLDANRNLVTGLLLGTSFLVIVLAGTFGPVPVRSFLSEGISPGTVLVELLKSIVSVVVIVLSINQLVLSPGLGPVGEQRERYDQSIELREEVENLTGTIVSPSSPAAFLAVLLDNIIDQAKHINEISTKYGDPDLQERTDEVVTATVDEARDVSALLSSSRFGEFEVISASLRFAISEKVRTIREIQRTDDESFPDSLSEAFDEMDELLEFFTVTREYFKTIYIREEYVRLSEGLLYTGLPSIILTYCAAQIYTPTVFPGQLLGIEKQLLFVSGAVTVSLTPFALLMSYVFRLAALSRSTLFVGPFDARTTERDYEESHKRGR